MYKTFSIIEINNKKKNYGNIKITNKQFPKHAACKLFESYIRKNNNIKNMIFKIQEKSKNSSQKIYGNYIGKIIKKNQIVNNKNKILYIPVVKLLKNKVGGEIQKNTNELLENSKKNISLYQKLVKKYLNNLDKSKYKDCYYVFEIKDEKIQKERNFYFTRKWNPSGYAKAILISDLNDLNNNKNNSIVTKTSKENEIIRCNKNNKLPIKDFRVKLDKIMYCINPGNKKIIKIMQDNLFIGAIVKYNTNTQEYDIINNKSIVNLYNYEVEFDFPDYLSNNKKNKFLSSNYYNFNSISYNLPKDPLTEKYKMKSINYNTESINNNNRIKMKNPNNGTNILYNNKFFRKKILYSKDLIKTLNSNNSNTKFNFLKIEEQPQLFIHLYKIYKKFYSRSNLENIQSFIHEDKDLKENFYKIKKFYYLLKTNNKIMNKYIYNHKVKNFNCDQHNPIDSYKQYVFNIKTNNKVFIIGDTHGSFHTFFRIILRLIKQKIIDKNMKLIDNAKIIILGDVLDRGYFAFEILIIIFTLMKINNNEKELNVIYNRGNHEDMEIFMSNGFYKEFMRKMNSTIKNKKNILNDLHNFYDNCSSAIILKHKKTKYWLCHGGFPFNGENPVIFESQDKTDIYKSNQQNQHILWNDFINNTNDSLSIRNVRSGTMLEIGLKSLYKFLKDNNIDFIIRGHQDNFCNNWLLKGENKYEEQFLPLTFSKTLEDLNENYKDIIQYQIKKNLNKYSKSNGAYCKIIPDNFILDKNNLINNKYHPVLTISTNSDIGRTLFNDSYAILD